MKIYFLIFLFLFSGCISNKSRTVAKSDLDQIAIIANDLLGDRFELRWNHTNEYVIVISRKKKLTDLFFTIEYFILETTTKVVLCRDTLVQGNVYWDQDNVVLAISHERIEDRMKKVTYLYNAKTKVKTILEQN